MPRHMMRQQITVSGGWISGVDPHHGLVHNVPKHVTGHGTAPAIDPASSSISSVSVVTTVTSSTPSMGDAVTSEGDPRSRDVSGGRAVAEDLSSEPDYTIHHDIAPSRDDHPITTDSQGHRATTISTGSSPDQRTI